MEELSSKEDDVDRTRTLVQRGLEQFIHIQKPNTEEKLLSMVENLTKKVDNLVASRTSESTKQLPSSQFSDDMKESYSHMTEWKQLKNIVELVNHVKDLELFPMSKDDEDEFFDGGGAILWCKTCFSLFRNKDKKLTPPKAARKLASDCKSICTGKYLSPERMSRCILVQIKKICSSAYDMC